MPYPFLVGTAQRRLASLARRSPTTSMTKMLFSTKALEAETFLSGSTSLYAEQMYDMYMENPNSVHPSWKQYFDNLEKGVKFTADDYSRPSTIPGRRTVAVVSLFIHVSYFYMMFWTLVFSKLLFSLG